jgi:hypothetical protein
MTLATTTPALTIAQARQIAALAKERLLHELHEAGHDGATVARLDAATVLAVIEEWQRWQRGREEER